MKRVDGRTMDLTLARIFGVLVARLLVEGWTVREIVVWIRSVAREIEPTAREMVE